MLVDMTTVLAKNHILTGRSALAYRNWGCSGDPRVIMSVHSICDDIYQEPQWFVPLEKEFESEQYEDIEIATINQAIFDCFRYDYDDSNIYELMDVITDEETASFFKWLDERPSYKKLIKEKLDFYKFSEDVI